MEDAFIDTLELFPRGLVYVGMSLALLVMAKLETRFLPMISS